MSAVLAVFTDPERKVRNLAEEHEKAAQRVEDLVSKAAVLEQSDDPADVPRVLAARSAVEAAKAERDLRAEKLEVAREAHALAVEEEERRTTEARYARMRKELEAFRASLTVDLVALGKKLGAHEALVDQLPQDERYRFWPATYCEAASRQLVEGVRPRTITSATLRGAPLEVVTATGTREVEIRLMVPVA